MKKLSMIEFRNAINKALAGVGNDLVNELVRVAPVDTGFLRESVRYEVDGNKLNIMMPEYAFHVEFGTRPHEIRAVNKKSLHWKSGGKDHFARVVWHPGNEPNPFIRSTLNAHLRDIVYVNLKRQLS